METECFTAPPPAETLIDAIEVLQRTPACFLPIRDPVSGRVVAVLVRPEHYIPPSAPRLGGMATPLGVYLTDGTVSGGAGFWGLVLTGVTLGALALAAQLLAWGALSVSARHGFDLWAWAGSAHRPAALRAWLPEALGWLPIPLIFVLLRLVPMSGTHAAEHQVVHCVERHLPLVLEDVRAQPRVHPRCGTNLFVGISIFVLIFVAVFCTAESDRQPVSEAATAALIGAGLPALILWRRIGGFVQQWFATRPATDAQIRSAIRAAEQVLRRRARHRAGGPALLRRIWTMGLLQVLLGYLLLYGPLMLALDHWPRLGQWLGLS